MRKRNTRMKGAHGAYLGSKSGIGVHVYKMSGLTRQRMHDAAIVRSPRFKAWLKNPTY